MKDKITPKKCYLNPDCPLKVTLYVKIKRINYELLTIKTKKDWGNSLQTPGF